MLEKTENKRKEAKVSPFLDKNFNLHILIASMGTLTARPINVITKNVSQERSDLRMFFVKKSFQEKCRSRLCVCVLCVSCTFSSLISVKTILASSSSSSTIWLAPLMVIGVTRLGNLLDFGQLFKAFGNN